VSIFGERKAQKNDKRVLRERYSSVSFSTLYCQEWKQPPEFSRFHIYLCAAAVAFLSLFSQ
jgi:hypothetical protein